MTKVSIPAGTDAARTIAGIGHSAAMPRAERGFEPIRRAAARVLSHVRRSGGFDRRAGA